MFVVLSALFFSSLLMFSVPANSSVLKRWQFDVFLDDKPIGEHFFLVRSEGEKETIETKASFDVKVFFVNAFSYRHENTEVWQGECLEQIDAVTKINGDTSIVEGQRADGEFRLGTGAIDECVSTFAYWNPRFLEKKKLLNSQTGQLESVQIESLGQELFAVRDEMVMAQRYQLIVDQKPIDLWYSSEGLWLGLSSEAKGGREIRYIARQLPASVGDDATASL
jgi:hypothetical protein